MQPDAVYDGQDVEEAESESRIGDSIELPVIPIQAKEIKHSEPSFRDLENGTPGPSATRRQSNSDNAQDGVNLFNAPPPNPVVTTFPTSLARIAQIFQWLRTRVPVEFLPTVLNFVFKPFFRGSCARPERLEGTICNPYVCVGYLSKDDDLQSEVVIEVSDPKMLFPQLRSAVYKVWSWHYVFSLKSLKEFSLYECQPFERHRSCELSQTQHRLLRQLFHDCMSLVDDEENSKEWTQWIHINLNKNQLNPIPNSVGTNYSLALQFGWSPLRISAVVLSPLLLSLAIGFWYMKVTGDVIAAWTISLYIVTTAAAIIGLLTVLSSIGNR